MPSLRLSMSEPSPGLFPFISFSLDNAYLATVLLFMCPTVLDWLLVLQATGQTRRSSNICIWMWTRFCHCLAFVGLVKSGAGFCFCVYSPPQCYRSPSGLCMYQTSTPSLNSSPRPLLLAFNLPQASMFFLMPYSRVLLWIMMLWLWFPPSRGKAV